MAVAIYARKSTESEDRQVQSLDDQLTVLRGLAKRQGTTVDYEYIEAKSAKEPGTRPEFMAMLRAVEDGKIDSVFTWQINRLSRNMVDGGLVAHLLHSGRLKWIKTPDREFRPEDSALLLAIETGVATSFIQDLRKNVRRGMEGKAARGWLPGKAPLGYRNNPVTREIEIDPERFYAFQRGWEMVASGGLSPADVHREWLRDGLTGPERGKPLSLSRVYGILRNPFYAGKFRFRNEVLPGRHVPMVSQALFDRVQVVLGRSTKHRDPERKHPYAGVFRCPVCGCQVTAESKVKRYKGTGRTVSYSYYRCTGARGCRGRAVKAETIDAALSKFAAGIAMPASIREWAERCLTDSVSAFAAQVEASQRSMDRRRSEIERKLARILDMRIDEELTQDEYQAQKLALSKQLEAIASEQNGRSSLAGSLTATICEKLDLLERARSWEDMATSARRGLLQSLAQEAFLTLESLELRVDPLLAKLAAFEPLDLSSESEKSLCLHMPFPAWCSNEEAIRTLDDQGEMLLETISIPLGDETNTQTELAEISDVT